MLRNANFRSRVFEHAKADLGLGALRVHGRRHTAASLAVAAGANVKVVQRMLGHSAAMTLDVYTGLFADDLEDVAERIESLAPRTCHTGRNGDEKTMGRVIGQSPDLQVWRWAPSGSNRRPTD